MRIDRVMAQAMPQPLAQFADVTLDDILVDVLTEEAVDGIEDLGLRHPAARVVHEILEDAALTARQRQHLAPHFRIAAIGEHPEIADHGAFGPTPCTCADGLDPGQDFAHVDRLADDIVHAAHTVAADNPILKQLNADYQANIVKVRSIDEFVKNDALFAYAMKAFGLTDHLADKKLMTEMLDLWLDPLRELDAEGDPIPELRSYIRRKIEMARDFPRESRLFANEMLQGAPHAVDVLEGELKDLVDNKARVIDTWMEQGKLARTDPYHLIFSIWATTQHYADFDVQVRAVLGKDRGGEGRFEDAARYLEHLFMDGLLPRK